MPQVAGKPYTKSLDTYRIIGENIKQLRLAVPITQMGLANYIGIANDSLCRIEKGEHRIEYALLKAIADIFGTTTDVLAIENSQARLRARAEAMENARKLLYADGQDKLSKTKVPWSSVFPQQSSTREERRKKKEG